MGSAPAGSSFEGRLGSSARRGAYVGIGVPGTYRVTRSRTTQAQSLHRSRVNPNAWIQPDDMVMTRNLSKVGGQTYVNDGVDDALFTYDPLSPYAFSPDNYPVAGKISGSWRWHCSVAFFNVGTLAGDAVFTPDVGDWPPGATGVEYETSDGVLVSGTCHMVGTARWSRGGGDTLTWGITVRRYPRLGYDFSGSDPELPGDSSFHDPETNPDLSALYDGGDVVGSLAALAHAATEDYDWALDDPDAEGWTAVFILPDSGYATVLADTGLSDTQAHAVDLSENGATTPYLEATFTPPRYRYTF